MTTTLRGRVHFSQAGALGRPLTHAANILRAKIKGNAQHTVLFIIEFMFPFKF